jgi:NarL family two-component system response regulator LiaR
MIVDDHDLFAEAINAALSDVAIDVAAILGTGREAIEYAVEHRPDVVILDLGLPDMSGLVAGRRILESWPEAKLLEQSIAGDLQLGRPIDPGAKVVGNGRHGNGVDAEASSSAPPLAETYA